LVKAAVESRPDVNRIHIATSFKDAELLVSMIRSSGCEILGFDMEWKPEYKKRGTKSNCFNSIGYRYRNSIVSFTPNEL